MRKAIFDTIQFPSWAKTDARYKRLDELDRYLDGEIYDHFDYVFYDEEVDGRYIKIKRRRPAVQFNLYAAVADQVARDLFAGFNAPVIQHPKENVRLFYDAIKEETEILSHMIELTNWATTGSSVATFKIVPFAASGGMKAKAVLTTRRSKDCTPFFNELGELGTLRIHYVTSGSELLAQNIGFTWDGKPVKFDRSYWFVRDYGSDAEITYYPILETQWKPMDVRSERLVPIESFGLPTELGFVPAHWFKRRTGKVRPYDGRCLWESAIPNMIEFDYSMSMMGMGIRYNASPQIVIKGALQNADEDGHFIGGPSRYLHFNPDHKDPEDGMSETGNGAELLEASGSGMKVGLEFYGPLLREIATIIICASRKDPNKLTTAMSAKGMEVLDKEYNNLIQEFRTVCGDNGYLKLLKKIGAACVICKHPLAVAAGITLEDLDGVALKWPPINPVGAQEFLYLCQGAAMLAQASEVTPGAEIDPGEPAVPGGTGADGKKTAGSPGRPRTIEPDKAPIMTRDEMRGYLLGSIDVAITSSNKDYLALVTNKAQGVLDPAALSAEEKKNSGETSELLNYAREAIKASESGIVDTSFKVGEG